MSPLWALALVLVLSAPANAQVHTLNCPPRPEALKRLLDEYGEVPAYRALAANDRLLEVLKAPDGSWSMIVTYPNGRSCLLATGETWQSVEHMPKGEEL
jgi:hypothetical protein